MPFEPSPLLGLTCASYPAGIAIAKPVGISAISPGSSGSPAVDLERQVVGIAMGIHTRGQNLGFLVPVERLKELMAEVGAAPTAVPLGHDDCQPGLAPVGGFPVVNLVISVVFFGVLLGAWWWMRRPRSRKTKASKPKDWVN